MHDHSSMDQSDGKRGAADQGEGPSRKKEMLKKRKNSGKLAVRLLRHPNLVILNSIKFNYVSQGLSCII